MRLLVILSVLTLSISLTACGRKDTTKQACQSWKDVSFNSVIGPLYDSASDSFKREYDKVDNELDGNLDYYFDVQRLVDLCATYGVKNADASMELSP